MVISREIIDKGMSLQGIRGPPDDARVLGGTDRRAEDATHALSYQTNVVMRSFAGQQGDGLHPLAALLKDYCFGSSSQDDGCYSALTARRVSLRLTAIRCIQVCLMGCWDVLPTSLAMTSTHCHS